MSIHPRSLAFDEVRPTRQQWTCTDHGDLPPGESACDACQREARKAS